MNFDPNYINIKIVKNNENPNVSASATTKKKKGTSVIHSRVPLDQM